MWDSLLGAGGFLMFDSRQIVIGLLFTSLLGHGAVAAAQ